MALGSKRILAIDWDRRHLRLVLARPEASGIELMKAVSVPISPDVVMEDAVSLGAFIREAARQAKVGAKRVVMSIPRDQVVLNTLNVPAGPADDLAAIVQFQIAKELPFAVDQATLDFAVTGRFDPGVPSSLLVAAVRNEQLQFYKSVAVEAGLQVDRIGLRPHANLIAALAKAPEFTAKSVLLVEVGPQLTEIDIIRDGALAFSRAASVLLPDPERLEEEHLKDSRIAALPLIERERDDSSRKAVGEVMVEVIRSFEAYRATEPAARVEQVIVCGATGVEMELSEMLAARFGVRAELYAPERALDLPAPRAKELRGFSAALGLAIGHDGEGLAHFDFLHPKKPVSRRTIRLKKVPAIALTGAFVIAAVVAAQVRYVAPLVDDEKDLKQEVAELKRREKVVLDFKAKVDALEDWQASEQYWPEVLKTVTRVFPSDQEAYVTRVEFETKRPQKKARLRPSGMRMTLRTAKLGLVNEVSNALKEEGFLEVRPGRDMPFQSRVAAEAAYHFDTSIDAQLPPRSLAPAADAVEEDDDLFEEQAAPPTMKESAPSPSTVVPRAESPARRGGDSRDTPDVAEPPGEEAAPAAEQDAPTPNEPDEAVSPDEAEPPPADTEGEAQAEEAEEAEETDEPDSGKSDEQDDEEADSEEPAEENDPHETAPDPEAEGSDSEGGAS